MQLDNDKQVCVEPLLSAIEAAGLLGVHPNTLLSWNRKGRVPSISVGRRVTFRASALNRWLEEQVHYQPANRAA